MKTIDPFANESDVLEVGDLTVENRTDRISIYGSIGITRDKEGLKKAKMLADLLNRAVKKLSSEDLPDSIPPPEAVDTVKNPFE